jgi:hypothetical protein
MLVCKGFFRTAGNASVAAHYDHQGIWRHTFVVISAGPLDLFCEASEVNNTRIIVSVDIQKLNSGTEVIHELP